MYSLGRIVIALLALYAVCSLGGATGVVNPSTFNQKLIGYWGCDPGSHDSNLPQLTKAINKGYNVIIYAFYLVGADGSIYPDPGSYSVPTKASIQAQVPGKQFTYLISLFGGQNGAAPTLTMTADAFGTAMFNNFKNLNTMYGFDGIDIDLENAWGGTGDVVLCALRTFFKQMHNYGFVISMAPQTTAATPEVTVYQTGNWNSYVPLMDTSIIQYVDIVAVQLYNNAVPYNDAAKYTNALTNGFQVSGCPVCDGTVTGLVKIPASKLAHGWPSSLGSAPGGCPGLPGGCPYGSQLSTLYSGSSVLKATSGVMTWSIEWDEYANWIFINAATQISFNGNGASGPSPTSAPIAPTTAPVAPTAAPIAPTAAPIAPTAAPVAPTAAPIAPTAAPIRATSPPPAAPPAQATTKPISGGSSSAATCNIQWSQSLSSSWQQGCNTVSMYTVTMTANAALAPFSFSFNSGLNSIWDATDNHDGTYALPSWMFSGGLLPAGYTATFGYIIVSDTPATISVVGNPCR